MKLLLLFIFFSCTTIEPVQTRDKAITFIRDDAEKREGRNHKLWYIYRDDDGIEYRLESYRGFIAVIPVRQ